MNVFATCMNVSALEHNVYISSMMFQYKVYIFWAAFAHIILLITFQSQTLQCYTVVGKTTASWGLCPEIPPYLTPGRSYIKSRSELGSLTVHTWSVV